MRDTLGWPGTWRMAWRWRRHAVSEVGYALSGELERADLLNVANAVYRQINP